VLALSLRQPWLWAVLHADKDVENRRWNTRFRGRFLLHAAKGCTQQEYIDAKDWIEARAPHVVVPPLSELPRGGICGAAVLVDVFPPGRQVSRWHMVDQHGFVLAHIRELPFRAYPGRLGFFEVPDGFELPTGAELPSVADLANNNIVRCKVCLYQLRFDGSAICPRCGQEREV
jgi:hypothetical protein